MTQFKDIPLATDQRNQSQVDLRNNMGYLMPAPSISATGILPVDHFATGDNGANPTDGFQKQCSFINRGTPASLVNAVNGQSSDGILYTTGSELHYYNVNGDVTLTPVGNNAASAITGTLVVNATTTTNISALLTGQIGGHALLVRTDSSGSGSSRQDLIYDFLQYGALQLAYPLDNITSSTSVVWNAGVLAVQNTGGVAKTFRYFITFKTIP